jgi:hypothetical protein
MKEKELKEENIIIAIYLEGDKLTVASNLPKLIQAGILIDAGNKLLGEYLIKVPPEEVMKYDNQKVLQE